MKSVKIFGLVFLLGAGLFLFPAGRPVSLIRIQKGPGLSGPLLSRLQVDIRQELETCFLAMADGEDAALLRRNGVRFSVLARDAKRQEFFLVRLVAPGTFQTLRARGKAVMVEPRTAVFWTDTGHASEEIPAGLPRKVLASRTVRVDFRPTGTAAPPGLQGVAADPLVETIVSSVATSNLSASVQSLQDFQTRYASTSNCEAAGEYLFGAFSALGLDDVRFEPFGFSSYTSRNVIAEKTGQTYPDDIVIICSHYDSISPSASRLTLAPGADDNASGTAAVLEAARILTSYPCDFTVRFINFSAEEWGLFGSRAYATAAQQAGDRIIGVVNLDMIAYANAMPEDLQIIVNPASAWLADRFLLAASEYGPLGATKTVDASFVYSDHGPFWDNGYPALLAIEDDPLTNPYYHQTTDTIDKLNPEFFTSAARASLGLLAELAQPIRAGYPDTPVGLSATPIVYSSLFNALTAFRLTWSPRTGAAGYNLYRTAQSHLNYVKVNDAPVAGTTFVDNFVSPAMPYYYVVTAVDGTGLESNRSLEAVAAFVSSFSGAAALTGLNLFRLWGTR